MEKSEWFEKIESVIAEQEKLIRKKDYKFFQIDRLLRVAERVDLESDKCTACEALKPEIENISGKVASFVNGRPSERRELEKRFDALMKHLKQGHQIYPVYYFVSLYSFLGILFGSALGWLVGLIIPNLFIFCLLSGFAIGVVVGYIYGNRLDLRARVAKKLI
jgi:hypothetical protein